MRILTVVLTLVMSQAALAAEISILEEREMESSLWKLPNEFTMPRIERLLNQFSVATYLKAFRFIGVTEDFDHGHILFEERGDGENRRLFPRAILYHTQENAHDAHWGRNGVDAKFDYINPTTRNWIQWLSDDNRDGVKIENARVYLDPKKKDPTPLFDETAPPQEHEFYTVHGKNLAADKLGFTLKAELQFQFGVAACDGSVLTEYDVSKGPITVGLQATSSECLRVFTTTMLIRR